jgi:hypothetical protein
MLFMGMSLAASYAIQSPANIKWTSTRLVVSDFKAKTDSSKAVDAMSAVQASYLVHRKTDKQIEIVVFCEFIPSLSWIKGSADSVLLQHEQLHFDIGELVCRKARAKAVKFAKRGDSIDGIETAIGNLLSGLDSLQDIYDLETHHGQNYEKQNQWNFKVQNELKQLSNYALDTITVIPVSKSSKAIKRNSK